MTTLDLEKYAHDAALRIGEGVHETAQKLDPPFLSADSAAQGDNSFDHNFMESLLNKEHLSADYLKEYCESRAL